MLSSGNSQRSTLQSVSLGRALLFSLFTKGVKCRIEAALEWNQYNLPWTVTRDPANIEFLHLENQQHLINVRASIFIH